MERRYAHPKSLFSALWQEAWHIGTNPRNLMARAKAGPRSEDSKGNHLFTFRSGVMVILSSSSLFLFLVSICRILIISSFNQLILLCFGH